MRSARFPTEVPKCVKKGSDTAAAQGARRPAIEKGEACVVA